MTKTTVTIALSNVTAHVPDYERSIPPEFDHEGAMIQGKIVSKSIPPWTPFEVDGDEADRLLKRHHGVRIPQDVDPVKWLASHADELGILRSQRGAR